MTARATVPFNHHVPVDHPSASLPPPVGAFVPVAWRVIVQLRAAPLPGGEVRPVTAFVGPIDQARIALEIITDWVGPVATVYIVNEEAARPNERSACWEHAAWVAESVRIREINKIVSRIGARMMEGSFFPVEYAFTLPRATYECIVKKLGARRLRGSLSLTATVATIFNHRLEQVQTDRALCVQVLIEEGAL